MLWFLNLFLVIHAKHRTKLHIFPKFLSICWDVSGGFLVLCLWCEWIYLWLKHDGCTVTHCYQYPSFCFCFYYHFFFTFIPYCFFLLLFSLLVCSVNKIREGTILWQVFSLSMCLWMYLKRCLNFYFFYFAIVSNEKTTLWFYDEFIFVYFDTMTTIW